MYGVDVINTHKRLGAFSLWLASLACQERTPSPGSWRPLISQLGLRTGVFPGSGSFLRASSLGSLWPPLRSEYRQWASRRLHTGHAEGAGNSHSQISNSQVRPWTEYNRSGGAAGSCLTLNPHVFLSFEGFLTSSLGYPWHALALF